MSNAELMSARSPWGRVLLLSLLAVVLAAGWLLFALAAGKAGLQKAVTAQGARSATMSQALTRTGLTNLGTKVQVLYATPDYYDLTGQVEAKDEVKALVFHVFMVTEENHDRVAPEPMPVLVADGRPLPQIPVKSRILTASDHHRTRLLRYPRFAPDGTSYVPEGTRRLELLWPDMRPEHRADHTQANPLRWDLPIAYPQARPAGSMSPLVFLALTAGLFAALSPCLIQLTLYYLSTLAGVSLAAGQATRRWPVVRTALWFSGGVVVAYTLGGFLAGLVGNMLQASSVLGRWGQPVAVASGVILIIMGLYTGAAGRAPVLCRLPLPRLARFARDGGAWRTAAMGFLISLGCLQCFGGAIFASLLLYVGSLGSPLLGALMLFLFSLGVAVPFLGAALAWSRVTPYLERIERITPYLSLGSSALMVLFGVLMVLDRFHYVSGVVLRWLPFLQS